MYKKIMICGLNGSGKTTLAKALAERLSYKHMDIEDYYFEPTEIPYSKARPYNEFIRMMEVDAAQHDNIVVSAVTGNFGDKIETMFDLVIVLDVPREVRLKRVRQRSLNQFGARVLEGGDMHESEARFFESISKRTMTRVTDWLSKINCKIVYFEGVIDVEELVEYTQLVIIGNAM